MEADDGSRRVWTLLAGAASGFGVWSTHFLGMIAYSPGLPIGFDLPLVLASLLIAIAFITAGLSLADNDHSDTFAIAAGVVIGLGITAMHYLGAQSISVPGRIGWESRMIAASVGLGVVGSSAALWIATSKQGMGSLLVSSVLLATAIIGLHFTGMAAMIILPDPRMGSDLSEISPIGVAWIIAAAAGMLLIIAVFAAVTLKWSKARSVC
jgi:NO-binding membrane sensor protein with MHYT domain